MPGFAFFSSALLVPEWKGWCRYGWIDCFHLGKLALSPLVLWAVAAFWTFEIWDSRPHPRPWIVLGFCFGSLVSTICLAHGILTLGLEFYWGLWIPLYTAVLYSVRSFRLAGISRTSWRFYLWSLVGSIPCWIFSVILSKRLYLQLPDQHPDCFVVSAAMRGHQTITGPFYLYNHGGRIRQANIQLITFWRLEALWAKSSPATHRSFRQLYNCLGPVAASLIGPRWAGDLAYFFLKPPEGIARSLLWLASKKLPEQPHLQ